MKRTVAILLAAMVLTLSGCHLKPWARTALEAARHACAAYAEQTGVTFKDVCDTEAKLQPFLDAILAANAAAAKGPAGASECPEVTAPQPPAPLPKAPAPKVPEKVAPPPPKPEEPKAPAEK